MTDLQVFLDSASIEDAVAAIRPDYRALLVAVDGLPTSTSCPDATSPSTAETLLARAETTAGELLATTPVEEAPHVAAWREAYRSFGAKPQRTRNSLEALLRRAGAGLPRVNPLTDQTTTALFILDALAPMTTEALTAAADDLVNHLRGLGPRVHAAQRLIPATATQEHT